MSEIKDHWRDRLSEYLDDELDGAERAEVEQHLSGCDACRSTLAELRRVVERARQLGDPAPEMDLWPAISSRIRSAGASDHRRASARAGAGAASVLRRRRGWTFSTPQLAAAAVLLVALSSSIVWQVAEEAGSRRSPPATPAVQAPTAQASTAVELVPGSRTASHDYRAAIAELERVLEDREQQLDTTTVRKVRERLALIDQAIEEARQALAADPSNAYLNRHLAGTIRRKLDLLRRTAALTEL